MKRLQWILVCLMMPSMVWAASEYAVAKRVEASMVVTGSIIVNPDGSVNSYALDKQDKLPPEVVEVINRTVPSWKFKPILMLDTNNKPALVKATMSLRLVARPMGDSNYGLSVRGVSFGKANEKSSDSVTYLDRSPPHYPLAALEERLSGIVYLVLRVGRDGHVTAADAEQVDLRAVASDAQMNVWRRQLALPAIAAAKKWTFKAPATGEEAGADHWVVRVPVNFQIDYVDSPLRDRYGQWDAYVPGPVNRISWVESDKRTAPGSADAVPDNGIAFLDDRRFVLLNPPSDG